MPSYFSRFCSTIGKAASAGHSVAIIFLFLTYWIHLVRARKAMEREMGAERYVSDAFVSYAHQDMKWVVRELLPKLEYEAKIRLCLNVQC